MNELYLNLQRQTYNADFKVPRFDNLNGFITFTVLPLRILAMTLTVTRVSIEIGKSVNAESVVIDDEINKVFKNTNFFRIFIEKGTIPTGNCQYLTGFFRFINVFYYKCDENETLISDYRRSVNVKYFTFGYRS